MYTVVKRDGKVVNFNLSKIRNAIIKAFDACDLQYNDDTIDFLALKVTSDFQSKIKEDRVSVEDIQDSVESVLIKAGYDEVAKAYILYRKQRERMRNMSNTLLDYKKIVDNYLKVNDWRVKENSTVTYSVGGLILSNSGAIPANYWLSEVYDEEIADAHRNADIHLHDLSMLTGYCAGWSLKIKRRVITQLMENGLYPYTKRYLGTFANHFSTIGLVGMNEACLNANWIREDLTHTAAQKFTAAVLNHMRERLSDYQEMYGDLYNLEATPAESTSYRFAKHDKERFPDIITAARDGDTPYYTNSSHLPVGYTEDIFTALDIQDELQTLYTSGTVFHAFLGEKLPDWKAAAALVRKIAENYRLPYYTLSPTYSVCRDHGYLTGEQYTCPICGQKTEVYSRITGYYRPVQNWNDGKSQEFKDRKTYDLGASHLTHTGPISGGIASGETEQETAAPAEMQSCNAQVYLFATPTCPNCKIAAAAMDKLGMVYEKVYANEHIDMAKEFGVRQAPTLVIVSDGAIEKYAGLPEIKKYLAGLAQ